MQELQEIVVDEDDILEEAASLKSKLHLLGISPDHPNYDKYVASMRDLRKTDPHAYHKATNLD